MKRSEAPPRSEVRRRLNSLGKRRKQREKAGEALAEDIKEALAAARLADIPMEEAAKRLGLNRTTLYQVYLDAGTDQPTRTAA